MQTIEKNYYSQKDLYDLNNILNDLLSKKTDMEKLKKYGIFSIENLLEENPINLQEIKKIAPSLFKDNSIKISNDAKFILKYFEDDKLNHNSTKIKKLENFKSNIEKIMDSGKKVSFEEITSLPGYECFITLNMLTYDNFSSQFKETIERMIELNIPEKTIQYECRIFGLFNENNEAEAKVNQIFESYIERKEALIESFRNLENIPPEISKVGEQFIRIDNSEETPQNVAQIIKQGLISYKEERLLKGQEFSPKESKVLKAFRDFSRDLKEIEDRYLFKAIGNENSNVSGFTNKVMDFISSLKSQTIDKEKVSIEMTI